MPRTPLIPPPLAATPFRGSQAVTTGLITWRMLRGAAWQRLFPDVYAYRGLELDHRAWCSAAALAVPPEMVFGALSAACLWGVAELPDSTAVSMVAPRDRKQHPPDRITVHYTTLAGTDVTSRDGLRLTTPERTVFDLGRRAERADGLVVLDAMLHKHLVSPEALRRMVRERNAWPRVDRLANLLRLADPRSESPMETRLRLLLVDAGVAPPAVQFEVRDTNGRLIGRVDLAWPEVRLAVEYDGDHHRERGQFRRDVGRLNALRLAGWTVLRFTADDVLRRRGETGRAVQGALAQAGWRSSTL
ncbi:type IV toxin-antitoxin system AbiEi family antitoxin [Actinoplanes sp. GCM10030250]|uniref:type IV toxin-antitoxin system AbiEi family antitoxin n=1 Tax=Actinoplanes sp. GCM10030250 TaxID=3273376 RepID=UPI00360FC869